ncbi:DUF3102 domain-containing protein [Levilactobacillus brevis]|uniref:DUF3102 domain-containing protein n=1 Tax=Levilactobacillus brevis TaxID=1580 RepID=UPI0006999E6A|nr:DUF3102 domain-containing protein [Levilactobacillus brevis]
MENAGRRDITSQAEETSAVELSHNLTTVTTEIKAYQSIGGQAIFEIGRRLKWVKENDLAHGEYMKWLKESVNMNPTTAQRFVKIASELPNRYSSTDLGWKALYEIATIQRTLSRKTSRRIVLLFYRPGCRYCQQIKRQVNRNEAQVNSSRQKETGVFLKVRTTNPANTRVLDRYQVESTPTFMVIKNGQVLKQYSGTNPAKIDQLMLRGDAK